MQRMEIVAYKTSAFRLKCALARTYARVRNLDRELSARRARYVMCYHRILPEATAVAEGAHASMWVSPETFETQLRWMLDVGHVVGYEEIVDFSRDNDRPLFCITFDDGWRDNLVFALPILARYGCSSTVFLATSAMENGALLWTEDLSLKCRQAIERLGWGAVRNALGTAFRQVLRSGDGASRIPDVIECLKHIDEHDRVARITDFYRAIGADVEATRGHMMTWPEVRELVSAGMRIGSHTHNHLICSTATGDEIEFELQESRKRIRDNVGLDVDAFAYPNARHSGTEGLLLQRQGYKYGFIIHNRIVTESESHFYLPRFICYEDIASEPDLFRLRLLEFSLFRAA